MGKNEIALSPGFTLLEVLIAITVTGLVVAVLANALIQTTQGQHLLEERLTAAVIGRGKLAEIVCGGESGLSGYFTAPYEKFTWNASEESLADGYAKVTFTVEWRDGRGDFHRAGFTGYRYPE
jgi:type II secretion system protein I